MAEEKPTSRPLEDVLREIFPELPEGAEDVLTNYLFTVAAYGPQSDLGREYYQDAVHQYPLLQEWFDVANEVAENPLFQVLR